MIRLLIRRSFTSTIPTISTIPTKSPLIIDEKDLTETFIRGSGPGGQSVNKSKNRVRLVHVPTGIQVQCHQER